MSDPRPEHAAEPTKREPEPPAAPRPPPDDAAEVSFNFGEDSGALPPPERSDPE